VSNATKTPDVTVPTGDELRKILKRAQSGDASTLPVLRKLLESDAFVDQYGGDIRTLALVRKLAVPVLQVNIARKQVNVAGTCVAPDGERDGRQDRRPPASRDVPDLAAGRSGPADSGTPGQGRRTAVLA
jgi:hypothetical protein